MLPTHLDLDLLRTFVVGVDLGSFARASEQLGRTQSAVSLQMRRLEEQTGQRILQKRGRSLIPTEAGQALLDYARRMLALNDEAISGVRAAGIGGAVRLGLPQDFVETELSGVLGRFARTHPAVCLDVRVDGKGPLLEQLRSGELDFAFHFGPPGGGSVLQVPAVWVGPRGYLHRRGEQLPLAMCGSPCPFRDMASASLKRARIDWRLTLTSLSVASVWAALAAGLGVTVRTRAGVPSHLEALGPESGLPKLASVGLHLSRRTPSLPPAAARLEEEMVSTLRAHQAEWR